MQHALYHYVGACSSYTSAKRHTSHVNATFIITVSLLYLVTHIHLTCSVLGRVPSPVCGPEKMLWWRTGQAKCTLGRPCLATGCSGSGGLCVHLSFEASGGPRIRGTKEGYDVTSCSSWAFNRDNGCVFGKYLICYISDSKGPQRIVSEGLGVFQGHLVRAVFLLVFFWPILVAFCLLRENSRYCFVK